MFWVAMNLQGTPFAPATDSDCWNELWGLPGKILTSDVPRSPVPQGQPCPQ